MTDERALTAAELDALERLAEAIPEGARMIIGEPGGEPLWRMHTDMAEWVTSAWKVMPALIAMARRVAALEAENARLRELAKWSATEYVKDKDALTYHEWRRLYYGDWVIGESE